MCRKTDSDINELRNRIDEIDYKSALLFNERMELVKKLSEVKKEKGFPIYDPSREKALKERLISVSGEKYEPVIDAVLKASKEHQKELRGEKS